MLWTLLDESEKHMRLVPLQKHPEVEFCTDCFFSGHEVRAVVATEIDVEDRKPLIGGLCATHAEVFNLSRLGLDQPEE